MGRLIFYSVLFLIFQFLIDDSNCGEVGKIDNCKPWLTWFGETTDCEIYEIVYSAIPYDMEENPAIKYLKFKRPSIVQYIPKAIFQRLSNLVTFSACNVTLNEIRRNTFAEAKKLENIYLTGNNLTEIVDYSFEGARELYKVHLSHNNIAHLSSRAFYGLKKLKEVMLDSNKIQVIFSGTFDQVKTIRLENNPLAAIHDSLDFETINQLNFTDSVFEYQSLQYSLKEIESKLSNFDSTKENSKNYLEMEKKKNSKQIETMRSKIVELKKNHTTANATLKDLSDVKKKLEKLQKAKNQFATYKTTLVTTLNYWTNALNLEKEINLENMESGAIQSDFQKSFDNIIAAVEKEPSSYLNSIQVGGVHVQIFNIFIILGVEILLIIIFAISYINNKCKSKPKTPITNNTVNNIHSDCDSGESYYANYDLSQY